MKGWNSREGPVCLRSGSRPGQLILRQLTCMSDVMGRGQPNTYFKAPGLKIGSRNIPAMHSDRLQSDGKAQAIAPFRALIAGHLNKWLKDSLEQLFGNS